MSAWQRTAALAAPVLTASAVVGFGSALTGFSHAMHPVALLGGDGVPMAAAFNMTAYVVPGLLLAVLAWSWRSTDAARAAGFSGRVGLQLLVLSALAFAAQGLLPLDPRDLDAAASRWHASAWMLWWIAAVAAAAALAWNAVRSRAGAMAAVHGAAGAAIPFLVLVAGEGGDAAIMQRVAIAAWFGWVLVLAGAGPLPARRG